MGFDGAVTLIETEKWEEIRRKLYFPVDVNEYSSSSKPLTDFTLAFLSEVMPCTKKPLKEGYVADVCRDGSVSPCALILGLIYIRRLARLNPAYLSQTAVPAELFLTAMVVASKYLQDEGEFEALVNSEWATVGQKGKHVVDQLEREFLNAIDWNLYVTNTEYQSFTASVQRRIACAEACRRGWWSYTDLTLYWDSSGDTSSSSDTNTVAPPTMNIAVAPSVKIASGSLATYLLCVTAIATSATQVTMETKSVVPCTSPLARDTADSAPSGVFSLFKSDIGLNYDDTATYRHLFYTVFQDDRTDSLIQRGSSSNEHLQKTNTTETSTVSVSPLATLTIHNNDTDETFSHHNREAFHTRNINYYMEMNKDPSTSAASLEPGVPQSFSSQVTVWWWNYIAFLLSVRRCIS